MRSFKTQKEGIDDALSIAPAGQVHVMGAPEQATTGILCGDATRNDESRLIFHVHIVNVAGFQVCRDCGHMDATEV